MKQDEQREKMNSEAVVPEASAGPTGSSAVRWPFRVVPDIGKRTPTLYPCTDKLLGGHITLGEAEDSVWVGINKA